MTSLDISSVRDFSKGRLRKILIDFYFWVENPIGPPDPNRIELESDYDRLIKLTNENLFRVFSGKESYLLSKQAFDKPRAFIYVKLLNTNKFTKKVGENLIEFRIVRKKPLRSSLPLAKCTPKTKSRSDLKRLKVNSVLFKPKLPKDQTKISRLSVDRLRLLERKFKHGFNRKYSEQMRKNLREIFQQSTNSSPILSRTSRVISQSPPNWNYCKAFELELSDTLDPSNLFIEIDVRLLEFMDISPKQAKIVKTLPLSDLFEDQFLDVVIIKDLKKFYLQVIESINYYDSLQLKESMFNLEDGLIKSFESARETIQPDSDASENGSKPISSHESTIKSRSFSDDEKLVDARKRNLLGRLFATLTFRPSKTLKQNEIHIDIKEPKESKDVQTNKKSDQKARLKDKKTDQKSSTDSSAKAETQKRKIFRPFLNLFKQTKQKSAKMSNKSRKIKKRKFENSAFLSTELQLGTKIEATKEKRLFNIFEHIDTYVILALGGKKSFINLKELRNEAAWRHLYTPHQIFILNQSKMHQTINAFEDALCRTIAIAKIYAKYARIKNFCYLNSTINDMLYQYSLSSKQTWFSELSRMLEEYLFENLEMIFRAEMPASLMAMYKYNYSKYGEFLFDNQVQLILGVIAIKGLTSHTDYMHLEDEENVFIHPESDDTFKDKVKKKKNLFIIHTNEMSTNSISEETRKENLIHTSQVFTNVGFNLLVSMAKGFERCTQVWMQYMETKKPEDNLEDLVHFSRALKNFCTGLARVFNRQQHLIVKRLLLHHHQKKAKDETDLHEITKKYLTMPRLPRPVVQSLVNLHLILDSHIHAWTPLTLKHLIDKLVLPVDYDEATDVAKRNAIFQASPYKDIYNSLRITIEKLQDLHKEQIQVQVTVQTIQGWFPLNVTQAWIAEEIQRVEIECSNWEELFKELAFIKSDYKIDKMEKLNLMDEKERQIKEKEFKDFLNEMVNKKLDDLVTSTVNGIIDSSGKIDLLTNSKLNFLADKTSNENLKDESNVTKLNLNEVKNLVNIKTLLSESENKEDNRESNGSVSKAKENESGQVIDKLKEVVEVKPIDGKETEIKYKEPAEQIRHELEKLIKSQSITSQLADKLIMSDDRKEKTVQFVLEALKKEHETLDSTNSKATDIKLELDKSKIENKLREELEKMKQEKELEEKEKRQKLECKIKEEFNSFKQAKGDRFNKRLQKFSQLKPIELINLMETCYENLIAFVSWPHAIFPAKTAKEIVYCIDLIAVVLKKFYQLLEQKGRQDFENIYKNSLERFIMKIQNVNYALMDNSFIDPDLRMNVVEWTDYQEKSWRGVVISLECSKQINRFCILNESKTDRKLRMVPKRKLVMNRKRS